MVLVSIIGEKDILMVGSAVKIDCKALTSAGMLLVVMVLKIKVKVKKEEEKLFFLLQYVSKIVFPLTFYLCGVSSFIVG